MVDRQRAVSLASAVLFTVALVSGLSTVRAAFSRTTATSATFTLATSFFSGELYAWGDNTTGQVGIGNTTSPQSSPQKVGTATDWLEADSANQDSQDANTGHSCAIREDKTLWCWGRNAFGQLGVGNTTDYSAPRQVGGSWEQVATAGLHSCGRKTGGTLWCWGYSNSGGLGTGESLGTTRTSPTQESTGATNWTYVAAGNVNTCGIKGGQLYCWGSASNCKLGNGSCSGTRNTPLLIQSSTTHVAVTIGVSHGCALRADGTRWCWGDNAVGQVGDASTTDRPSPVQADANVWTSISAGRSHSCGLRSPGTLWCWGGGATYRLGLGDLSDRTSPVQVGADADWARVDSGDTYTCANRTSRAIYCWGDNTDGQLGLGNTTTQTGPTLVAGRQGTVFTGSSGATTSFAIG